MSKRVAHLTSVHHRGDTRVFEKECRSLARAGYDVHLVVADSKGDSVETGVTIHDVGRGRGRIGRMTGTVARVYRKARELRADLYHLHDPELIPVGLMLKRLGGKVVFDCHEDVPLQLLSKPYLAPVLRKPISLLYAAFERVLCPHFDALVTVTPNIEAKLKRVNTKTSLVRNYPILDGIVRREAAPQEMPAKLIYVGSISSIRGIREMVRALDLLKGEVTLDLLGSFADEALHKEMKAHAGWQWVNELGWQPRDAVTSRMSQSMAGLVLFHPEPNHVEALPNKLFEYMSAGIPVIASDVELWRKIVESGKCGICVDPLDPAAIADAVRYLIKNPGTCDIYGRNGQTAVVEDYNWANEARELLQLYENLLHASSRASSSG